MLVYLTSPWVPPEWVKAHGLEPRGVWFAPDFDFDRTPLGAGVCAFSATAERFAEQHPEAATVFSTHCDQLRRGFDALPTTGTDRRFLFNLPSTWQTSTARDLFTAELDRLARFLIGLGGHWPEPGALAALLATSHREQTRLAAAAEQLPARQFAEAVARFHWDGQVSLPETGSATRQAPPLSGRPRVALLGGPLPRTQWRVLDALDTAGARVVLNATEPGERTLAASPAAPNTAPGQYFLDRIVDVFQRPNTRLFDWLEARLKGRQVEGIILWAYVGCDLWRAEAASLREAFGLPVLLLDADEVANGWARLTGRVEAFVESLAARSL